MLHIENSGLGNLTPKLTLKLFHTISSFRGVLTWHSMVNAKTELENENWMVNPAFLTPFPILMVNCGCSWPF